MRLLAAVGVLLGISAAARAQTWDPGPGWEFYGDRDRVFQSSVSFSDVGSLWATQLRLDSLVVDSAHPRGRWSEVNRIAWRSGPAFFATSRVLLTSPGIRRSRDRGRSWESVGAYARFHPLPSEAGHGSRVLVGQGPGGIGYTDDYGDSFVDAAGNDVNWRATVQHWAAMPEEAAPPRRGGRLFAGAYVHGLGYSDDGGETWVPSGLWHPALIINELETLAIPPEEGGGIRVVAVGLYEGDTCGCRRVWASDDAGATFSEVQRIPIDVTAGMSFSWEMTLLPVLAGRASGPTNPVPSWQTVEALLVFHKGAVFRTVDGGKTWARVPGGPGRVPSSNPKLGFVASATLGPDGRLYPSNALQGPDSEWPVRSAGSYVTVSAPPPPTASALGVGPVAPNPTLGDARVPLHLPGPASVRVEVLDALGRVVASEPPLTHPAGQSSARLRVTGLPVGVYVVRVVAEWAGGVEVGSRRFTIAR